MFIIDKIFNLKIDTKNKNITTVTGLKQYDNNSVLNVTLLQNNLAVDLSNCTVRINFLREDNKVLLYMANINNATEGKVSIKLSPEVLEKTGNVKTDISVFDSNLLKITSATFTLKVDKAIYDDTYFSEKDLDLMQQEYVREKERQKAESARIENELERITKEGQRNSNENTRISNEEARKKAEDTRVAEWNDVKKDANNIKNTLDTTIDTANKSNSNLENTINNADKLKQELNPETYVTNAKYNAFEKKTTTQYEDTTKQLKNYVGNNLLRYSGYPYYSGLKGTAPRMIEKIDDIYCLAFKTQAYVYLNNNDLPVLETDQKYTFSFLAKASENTNFKDDAYFNSQNKFPLNEMNLTTEWKKYYCSFVWKGGNYDEKDQFRIHLYPNRIKSDGSTITFYLANWKLEKGTIATDWTPAIEDYNYLVDTQSKRIDVIEKILIEKGFMIAQQSLTK